MGLKPDHWIRKMAQEHGMIEPFEDRQVREGVISYGVSSYGYDMRVADDFKVFTNVYSAVVDPKQFTPESFVDIQADVCVIPPNSFALARSVEYFRIPRNVLTITLGKSTYARCFRGDTRVALVDGTSVALEDMAKRSEDGEMFWGYSIGQYGRIMVTLLESPRYIGRDALVEIVLDNDESIYCTPDHEFIRRDGQLAQAHNLRPGDSLMPLYRKLGRGYEMVYQPLNGHLHPTHRLANEWNIRHDIYADAPNTHRHHIDHNRQNSTPWNIMRMEASEHIRYHNEEYYQGEDFDPEEHSNFIQEALERRAQDAEWRKHYSKVQRDRATQFWNEEKYVETRAALIKTHLENWTPERREQQRLAMEQYHSDPANRALKGEKSKAAWARDDGTCREKQREIARNMKIRRFPETLAEFRGNRQPKNHKVKRIKELPGDHDVYCLTVPEAGNFALEAGVFVRNCGIITNITPFEPGWEGYVTLEISNTTPLPAKVYANEGIAQVIFFEADEECEVSYADKKGKYQGQTGVTPPRL